MRHGKKVIEIQLPDTDPSIKIIALPEQPAGIPVEMPELVPVEQPKKEPKNTQQTD
jgi:hypothetical protein